MNSTWIVGPSSLSLALSAALPSLTQVRSRRGIEVYVPLREESYECRGCNHYEDTTELEDMCMVQ
jgi:hypothetical protein